MFWAIVKGHTDFPKWACIFNPLTMKILLNLAAKTAPNTKLFNGIRMKNMGLGALFTFVGLLILNFRTQFNIGAEREACYNESKKQIGGKLI